MSVHEHDIHGHNHAEHAHHHTREHQTAESTAADNGAVFVTVTTNDDAVAAAGVLTVAAADKQRVRAALQTELENLALFVEESGGVIGHIKASLSVTETEMLSVLDARGSTRIKRSPAVEISIKAAAVVFFIDSEVLKGKMSGALENVKRAENKSDTRGKL